MEWPGLAVPLATKHLPEAAGVPVRPLGATGLQVAAVGFGTYRIDGRPAHLDALQRAVAGGVNLLDTASNYGLGTSERIVGDLLAELGPGRRQGIVVCTKAGYLQGPLLDTLRREWRPGKWRTVEWQPDHWHTVDPALIARSVETSRARMRLSGVDLLLLHNPEKALEREGQIAERRDRLYATLQECFEMLEEACDRDDIGGYGVSSNTFGADPERAEDAIELNRVVACARAAGGASARLKAIQLPLNPLERDCLPVAARAHDLGLAVLTNRPLNAIAGDRLFRLANAARPQPVPAATFRSAAERVQELETEAAARFRSELGALGLRELGLAAPIAAMARGAAVSVPELRGWIADRVEPRLRALRSRCAGGSTKGGGVGAWLGAYEESVRVLCRVAWRDLAERDEARVDGLLAGVAAELPGTPGLTSRAQRALAWSATRRGVTAVLNGMRSTGYVDEALEVVRACATTR
jgi:aryl-alcohol dehydrogenase-like predicted oxidoreductase